MTDQSAIIERIRKLQQMRVENGCTEDEAETAMRMWMGLMARHGIEQDQITPEDDTPRAKIGTRISVQFKKHQLLCAMAAGELYGCQVITYSGGKFGLEFVGRPENIEAAEMTMFWLMNQMEAFYKQALPRGLTKTARAEFRRTFKEACAARILNRAHRMMDEMKQNEQAAQSATGSTALVVQGHFDKLKKENELVLSGMALRKSKPISIGYGSGTQAGREAGDRVKLRKEIG